jgi:tetratricopeptide (TPR) repeat protein
MTYNWLPATASAAVITITACNNPPVPAGKRESLSESPAITSLKAEISKYPDSTALYDKLIDEYSRGHNYAAAAAWCDSVISRNPEQNFLYWMEKGDLQRQAGNYTEAIHSYNRYLQKYPDDEQVLLNLANAQAEAGHPATLLLTNRIVQQFPTVENRTDAYFINGVYYSRSKKWDSAIASYDKAITNRNTFWEAHLEKGIAYYDAGQYDKALVTFKQLQQANPSYPDAYYWIGKCNELAKNKTEALKNYEAAYSLDKTFADAKMKIDSLSRY